MNQRDNLRQFYNQHNLLPTFNFYSLSQLTGICDALAELQKPALIGVSNRCWGSFDESFFKWVVNDFIPLRAKGYGFAHLDHGWSLEVVQEVLELGFPSVMFDGSKMDIDDNIVYSTKAQKLSADYNSLFETEVGIVGRPGLPSTKTSFEEVKRFVSNVSTDLLAISIGTFHGEEPSSKLDTELGERVHQETGIKLALHGGSGVSNEDLVKVRDAGFYKFNFASDIDRTEQRIYSELDDDYMSRKSNEVQKKVIDEVKKFCLNKFEVLYDGYGSN